MKKIIKRFINLFGFNITRFNTIDDFTYRVVRLMQSYGIDTIFDIGANRGEYTIEVLQKGYTGKIVCFEPVKTSYSMLRSNIDKLKNSKLQLVNIGLGDFDGEASMNISANLNSSSILPMLDSHRNAAPDSHYIDSEKVIIRRFDSIIDDYHSGGNLFLKIDTQGYEMKILRGATNSFHKITGIQLETSLVPLYDGESLVYDTMNFMIGKGFKLMGLIPGFTNRATGQLLQADCIFFKDKLVCMDPWPSSFQS
jgi:FkbM family methyltransferase